MARIKVFDKKTQSWVYADKSFGKDGEPCSHSWSGTTLTITSASGTSSADLKGDKGITWKGEWNEDTIYYNGDAVSYNGTSYIFCNGIGTVPPGLIPDENELFWETLAEKGDTGANGKDGKTPVKGTDYYTAADKTEMVGQVKAAMPTLIIVGIDEDEVAHTWTVYGVGRE